MKTKPRSSVSRNHAKNLRAVSEGLRQFDALPDSAHVRLPIVAALFRVHFNAVAKLVEVGSIPAPQSEGKSTFWIVGELRQALREAQNALSTK